MGLLADVQKIDFLKNCFVKIIPFLIFNTVSYFYEVVKFYSEALKLYGVQRK